MDAFSNTTQNDSENFGTNKATDNTLVVVYTFIGVCGLFGNLLVIYVILNSPKMKTVTNMYIFNLALSDLIFLWHIIFVIITTIVKHWVFGEAMCKIYNVIASISMFSSILTLTSLSVDRYITVCKPVISQKYRRPIRAVFVIIFIWVLSFLFSMAIILYSKRVPQKLDGKYSCQVDWPHVEFLPTYIIYTFIVGFAVPLCFIATFYTCVIIHMKRSGPANRQRSTEQRRNHRKVTYLVLAIILVYIICWLPYWVFQITLVVFSLYDTVVNNVAIFHVCTVLQFANSMVNPILYAFLSENFRNRFKEVFKCPCIFKERVRYILREGRENRMELDSLRRNASEQTEAETHQDDQRSNPHVEQKDNGGVYTGL